MRLTSFIYSEHEGAPEEWNLAPLELQEINLIVGVNSSGKSRALNVIAGLSNILSGKKATPYLSGTYQATFLDGDVGSQKIVYSIKFTNRTIETESLKIGRTQKLARQKNGKGWLFAEKFGQKIAFQAPPDQVIAASRRDSLQHPYLEKLHKWANSLKHIQFGTDLGKNTLAVIANGPESPKKSWTEIDNNAAIFRRAHEEFGAKFIRKVLADFAKVGYPCSEVGLMVLPGLEHIATPAPVGFFVKEKSLLGVTTQITMSTGMYRTLAILVSLNAAVLSNQFQTILIDDIGEGLDYERSKKLISLLVERANQHSFQLLMTTNDRFVMNAVPLKYWTVLQRTGNSVASYNIQNSRKRFVEFEYLGLNNFDFFTGNYFLEDHI